MEAFHGNENHFINYLTKKINTIGFYQLIRLLELYLPNYQLIFSANFNLAFPLNDINNISKIEKRIFLTQSLFNIAGQNGILPDHVTEYILGLFDKNDFIFADFLTIFSSQLLHLYYAAWKLGAFFVNYEQCADTESLCKDYTIRSMSALIGVNTKLHNVGSIYDIYLNCAGILLSKARSAQGLETLLNNYYEFPVTISECSGQWLTIERSERSCLTTLKQQNQLGHNLTLGTRVWQIQNQFTIIIGALDYQYFFKLLSDNSALKIMKEIITFYCSPEYIFNLEIIISYYTVPFCELKQTRATNQSPYQLGWNTWLKVKNQEQSNSIERISKKVLKRYEN